MAHGEIEKHDMGAPKIKPNLEEQIRHEVDSEYSCGCQASFRFDQWVGHVKAPYPVCFNFLSNKRFAFRMMSLCLLTSAS